MSDCKNHRLCERIGGPCSLAIHRSRGCRPNVTSKELAPGVLDEVRRLLPLIEANRDAAIRLAALVRREALDDRNLVALVADEDPDLAPALTRLCARS